jgi:hypothetical protein
MSTSGLWRLHMDLDILQAALALRGTPLRKP